MVAKRMLKLTLLIWLLTGTAVTAYAETDVIEPTQQSTAYSQVSPQVSFEAVTELSVKQADQKVMYGDDPLQYGLLWQPLNQQTNKPLIVLVHGGCWLNAFGVDHSMPMSSALSQAGYPVWSLEYRRSGDVGGGWPGSFNDIKLALSQLVLLEKYNINTGAPILMGHSAGGHLALLAASELPDQQFKQVIGLAAITDISRYALGENNCQTATPQFMHGLPHEQSAAYHQANLLYRQLPDSVLLLHGDADLIVPTIQSQLHGVTVEMMPEAGHFDWIHPGAPAFQKLLAALES